MLFRFLNIVGTKEIKSHIHFIENHSKINVAKSKRKNWNEEKVTNRNYFMYSSSVSDRKLLKTLEIVKTLLSINDFDPQITLYSLLQRGVLVVQELWRTHHQTSKMNQNQGTKISMKLDFFNIKMKIIRNISAILEYKDP